ncbi:DUF4926 domain-containing protein [Methylobacterium sp. NEAU 140]|uniref:DUF4926 domain-containing protein n=1 Tax=Methylobacterium sp. NEAU 140 TaxID=3064945 RepID=UPI0027373FB9|nr:DUF4926 domain-containing protein [Methylobacterium sp. NEAU 140]MDP4022378.1 DUF4926 domain-containing protein [Methylobacterium sp. NEAU 140]
MREGRRGANVGPMSFAFAYRIREDVPRSDLRDLDRVALTAAAVSDDGDTVAAGTEGTIVSVYNDGEAYTVEFAEPPGTLATVEPAGLRLVERAAA